MISASVMGILQMSWKFKKEKKEKEKEREKKGLKSLLHNSKMQKTLNTGSAFITPTVAKPDPNCHDTEVFIYSTLC